jgi:hypothetical protein
MQTVDDELETIHLYVVREEDIPPPPILPLVFSILALLGIIGVGILAPNRPLYEQKTFYVPAQFLPPQTFHAAAAIIPTGKKTYPATQAHGLLIVYNGSILSQVIPQGMIVTTRSGIEVVTDQTVYVPAGNPPLYGIASIPAHALLSGSKGNIPAFTVNNVYGTSLYIRNLQAFTGGADAYTKTFVTPKDRQTAIGNIQASLTRQVAHRQAFLTAPCREAIRQSTAILTAFWTCQFATFTVAPYMHVLHARLVGTQFLVNVKFVARPRILVFK